MHILRGKNGDVRWTRSVVDVRVMKWNYAHPER